MKQSTALERWHNVGKLRTKYEHSTYYIARGICSGYSVFRRKPNAHLLRCQALGDLEQCLAIACGPPLTLLMQYCPYR